jgi:hypothetical protein
MTTTTQNTNRQATRMLWLAVGLVLVVGLPVQGGHGGLHADGAYSGLESGTGAGTLTGSVVGDVEGEYNEQGVRQYHVIAVNLGAEAAETGRTEDFTPFASDGTVNAGASRTFIRWWGDVRMQPTGIASSTGSLTLSVAGNTPHACEQVTWSLAPGTHQFHMEYTRVCSYPRISGNVLVKIVPVLTNTQWNGAGWEIWQVESYGKDVQIQGEWSGTLTGTWEGDYSGAASGALELAVDGTTGGGNGTFSSISVASLTAGNLTFDQASGSVEVQSAALLDFVWLAWALFAVLVLLIRNPGLRLLVAAVGLGVFFLPLTSTSKVVLGLAQAAFLLYLAFDWNRRRR